MKNNPRPNSKINITNGGSEIVRKPVRIVYLLRCGFKYHDRAFTNLLMAENEADKIQKETGKRPEVVMKITNGEYVCRHILCVNRFECFKIDGKRECQNVDSHATYLTIESLEKRSDDVRYIKEFIDTHNVNAEISRIPGVEYWKITSPYIKTFMDVGSIKVLFSTYSVKRIRVIRE